MARDGLKKGLALEQEFGFNPLRFGFIGSTDTHNGNPGDTEEWDYRGSTGLFTSPAVRRHEGLVKRRPQQMQRNPGGLAAVWASENTRDAIFDAMKARETYATSGTRIALRFFASWDYSSDILASTNLVERAYVAGVPMGAVLSAQAKTPSFIVWAAQDTDSAPLQKIQIIKGWLGEKGPEERVIDVACANGSDPDPVTQVCPESGASVDLADCSLTGEGATELKALWIDEDYAPAQPTFYYVRVLQNPTCRYSTYDALRLGSAPPEGVEATVRERAWSSPIWFQPYPRFSR